MNTFCCGLGVKKYLLYSWYNLQQIYVTFVSPTFPETKSPQYLIFYAELCFVFQIQCSPITVITR